MMIAAEEAWFLEDDHVKGTEIFQQIAEAYPKDPRAVTWLGMCYMEREEKDETRGEVEGLALRGFLSS
jgi:Flp pilus assembly protein TadD